MKWGNDVLWWGGPSESHGLYTPGNTVVKNRPFYYKRDERSGRRGTMGTKYTIMWGQNPEGKSGETHLCWMLWQHKPESKALMFADPPRQKGHRRKQDPKHPTRWS